jgi:hypothetical protein
MMNVSVRRGAAAGRTSMPAQQKSGGRQPFGRRAHCGPVCREEAFTIEERASARGGGEMMVSLLR